MPAIVKRALCDTRSRWIVVFVAGGWVAAGGCSSPDEAAELESVHVEPEALTGAQTAVTYTYDVLGRLRTAEYPGSTKRFVVNFDDAGNRTGTRIDTTITNPSPTPPTPPP